MLPCLKLVIFSPCIFLARQLGGLMEAACGMQVQPGDHRPCPDQGGHCRGRGSRQGRVWGAGAAAVGLP